LTKARQLVDVKKDDGFAALHLAALNGHLRTAETLIDVVRHSCIHFWLLFQYYRHPICSNSSQVRPRCQKSSQGKPETSCSELFIGLVPSCFSTNKVEVGITVFILIFYITVFTARTHSNNVCVIVRERGSLTL